MDQPKVSVIYHGADGAIQVLAEEAAAGAEEEGAVVRVRRVPDRSGSGLERAGDIAAPEDVRWADAVVLGSPSRYGNLASPLKSYVEQLKNTEGERLQEIVWSGFASDDGVLRGGRAATLMTLFRTMLDLGGILVSPPRASDLHARALARRTGRDVASVARRLLVGAGEDGQVPVLTTRHSDRSDGTDRPAVTAHGVVRSSQVAGVMPVHRTKQLGEAT
jgi:NAD(P)H dehydrogenase (quinone)